MQMDSFQHSNAPGHQGFSCICLFVLQASDFERNCFILFNCLNDVTETGDVHRPEQLSINTRHGESFFHMPTPCKGSARKVSGSSEESNPAWLCNSHSLTQCRTI